MIKKLNHDVSMRIAAGEVIERPVSIVKELIENSIDAFSREITLYLEQGGKTSIVIEDDGIGIPFEELPLAVERYATSKISEIEDLERISTLGYRGEALASISAVSKLEIRSRVANKDIDSGGIIKCEAEKILIHSLFPCKKGTRIQVDNLFFNLPARRKFLKNSSAELRRILQVINDYSLIHPEITFRVFSDNRKIIEYHCVDTMADTVKRYWGEDTSCFYTERERENIHLRIWWNPLPDSRRVLVSLFVNGRRVQDSTVRAAIISGDVVVNGEWIALIDMPTEELDVNIHPTKEEVRFRKSQNIFKIVYDGTHDLISQRLSFKETCGYKESISESVDLMPMLESQSYFMENELNTLKRTNSLFDDTRVESPQIPSSYQSEVSSGKQIETQIMEDKNIIKEFDINYIGQTGRGFLLFDMPDSLAILDPHAAHERILFEEILNDFKDTIKTQTLALPMEIPLMVKPIVYSNENELKKLGFTFDEKNLLGVPDIRGKGHLNPIELLRSALKGIENETDKSKIDREVWWRIARLACRNAVKLGWHIEKSEAEELMNRLKSCETPFTCPHGRPTIYLLNNRKLEEWFER
ncbi:MAG: DNA mismatch repair endonuclease MutL [Synergistaceae bacterium]